MIYFVQHIEKQLIKIGCTADIAAWMSSLASVYGAVKLLGVTPGESDNERALHMEFKNYNVRDVLNGREWFAPVSVLMDYIVANCELSDQIYRVVQRADKKVVKEFGLISTLPAALARKEERDGIRYTQAQIARATGISLPTMTRIFRGDIETVRLATMRKLVEWLECDYKDIMIVKREPDEPERETA